MSRKWYYYGFKETGYIWKQKEPINGNPSTEYHLWILDKKEAKAIAKQNGTKVNINVKPKHMGKKDKKSEKAKGKDKKNKKEKKGKKDKNQNTGSKDAKVVRSLDGSIALSKLQHVMMNKKNKKGKKIRCIVIPVKENFLYESDKGGVYLNIRVNLKDKEDEFNQHGFVGQSVPSDIYKEASDKEKEKMKKTPILGGLKDWEYDGSSNDASGSAGDDIDEGDDLPF